ncbi:hypothetical protein BaRGS_00032789 [Batillaria attramentaria]|uniref:Uncharacterized protein n=1 Tax=Batillaria attramentaria TaxID=370345 RepID=A0ABD0JLU8_9CAEN
MLLLSGKGLQKGKARLTFKIGVTGTQRRRNRKRGRKKDALVRATVMRARTVTPHSDRYLPSVRIFSTVEIKQFSVLCKVIKVLAQKKINFELVNLQLAEKVREDRNLAG